MTQTPLSSATPRLGLPLLQEAQAQKHVTHNEALAALDALVQPVVVDRDRTGPPATPAEGDCHVVAPGGTGAWEGRSGQVAVFSNGGWLFLAPRAGWRVRVLAEAVELVHDGADWVTDLPETLGLGATADATNRLAVAAPATLLTHEGAGHRLKINKAGPQDTASLLFQTGWSGRAEMGCAGGDGFSVKVSADGAAWRTAFSVDPDSGAVSFPSGVVGMTGPGAASGPLGGHAVAVTGERNNAVGAGQYLSMGNGATAAAGAVMPVAGQIVAASLSFLGGDEGDTVELAPSLDKAEQPGHAFAAISAGQGQVATGVADFSDAPLAVPAGTALGIRCLSVAGSAQSLVATLFVVFD